jgi:hypothetical protein
MRCWHTVQLQGVPDIEKLKHVYATAHFYTNDSSQVHAAVEDLMLSMAQETMAKGGHTYVKKWIVVLYSEWKMSLLGSYICL